MLKSRLVSGLALLLAVCCAFPISAALKAQEDINADPNTSEAVDVRMDNVEYAVALENDIHYTTGSNLSHATASGVVSLPKSCGECTHEAASPISVNDPIVQRSFEEEDARREQEEKAFAENYVTDDFVFDINKTIFPVTEEEVEMLKYVVQAEAGGGSIEAKRIVTFSIVNRVLSPSFPSTLYRVLHAENQFPTIQNYYTKAKVPSESTCRAVEEVLMGACTDNSQNCLYFYCTACHVADWIVDWFENDLVYLYTVGCDRFFTDPS